jgi:methylglutaconyl-CoA hydratase
MKYSTIRLERPDAAGGPDATDRTDSAAGQASPGRVALITLAQPERRNALDDVMIRELTDALLAVNRDNAVRAVVLTGEGRAFCAGMDLGYIRKFSELGEHENLEDARNLMTLLRTITTLKKPVIAAVNGPAMGGGCGLAAACDFVFASDAHGRFGVPEVKIGFVPAVILMFLVRRMGEGAAREFVLAGSTLEPPDALRKGLATETVPHERLLARSIEFAGTLASTTSPSSVAVTKDLFLRIAGMTETEATEYATQLNALTRKTEDFRKGLDAVLRKETPRW